jgi:phosphate-selective porin OprO/OprP
VRGAAAPLRGVGFGIAAIRGRQGVTAPLPVFRTASVQQPFFSYVPASPAGVRTRYSPQASYYYKGFGALAEYVHSAMPVRSAGSGVEIGNTAWQVAASLVLTGETATDSSAGIRPRANFDFGAGHWGALQVAGRYHMLTIDDLAFDLDLAVPGSSRKAEAWTAGLNWFLTQNLKYVFNFERTVFDGDADGPRKAENAIVFRTQVSF